MTQIKIYSVCEESVKALELLKNFNAGINKNVGTTSRGIVACTNEYALLSNKDFAQYLIDNNEVKAYMGIYARPDHFSIEQAARIFTAYPEGYLSVLERHDHVREDSEYRAMIDNYFEEYAPRLTRLPFEYLPKRHLNNKPLIMKLIAKNPGYVRYLNDCDLEEAVKVDPKCLEHKTSAVTGKIVLMRKLCTANPECAVYACSPITTNAGVKRQDSSEEKKRKVNAWLTGTGERKALNNASGGGVARLAPPKNTPAKPKFKI